MWEVVLVTGASHGIGLATVDRLAKAGYRVYAGTRDPAKAKELNDLSHRVYNVVVEKLDVTSDQSVADLISKIYDIEGRLDCVVNNAGYGIFGPTDMHTMQEIKDIFEVNVNSVIRVTNEALPIMRKQMKGRVVNINSIAGAIPSKNMPVYSAAKAALESLTATYAFHNEKWNIRFFNIQPGPVVTNFESSTVFGTRLKDVDNPHLSTLEKNRKEWADIMNSGQKASEVAEVILEAIEDTKPKHWYQTSKKVGESIVGHFRDLTGMFRIPKMAR